MADGEHIALNRSTRFLTIGVQICSEHSFSALAYQTSGWARHENGNNVDVARIERPALIVCRSARCLSSLPSTSFLDSSCCFLVDAQSDSLQMLLQIKPVSAGKQKKKRIVLACVPCNRMKVACNGCFPCARCVRQCRASECVPREKHPRRRKKSNSLPASAVANAVMMSESKSTRAGQQADHGHHALVSLVQAAATPSPSTKLGGVPVVGYLGDFESTQYATALAHSDLRIWFHDEQYKTSVQLAASSMRMR